MISMKRHTTLCWAAPVALAALAVGALGTAAQAQQYQVTLNTTTLKTVVGNLDFQFSPGPSSPNASLQISGFTTNGTLAGTATDAGGGAGALPGTLTIANSGSFNDVFQGITFGTTLSFIATFSGAATSATFGSTFAFSLYDAAGANTLLGTNSDGSVLDILANPNGTQTITSGSPAVTATPAPVPESSGALSLGLLLLFGVGGLVAARRKRRVTSR